MFKKKAVLIDKKISDPYQMNIRMSNLSIKNTLAKKVSKPEPSKTLEGEFVIDFDFDRGDEGI